MPCLEAQKRAAFTQRTLLQCSLFATNQTQQHQADVEVHACTFHSITLCLIGHRLFLMYYIPIVINYRLIRLHSLMQLYYLDNEWLHICVSTSLVIYKHKSVGVKQSVSAHDSAGLVPLFSHALSKVRSLVWLVLLARSCADVRLNGMSTSNEWESTTRIVVLMFITCLTLVSSMLLSEHDCFGCVHIQTTKQERQNKKRNEFRNHVGIIAQAFGIWVSFPAATLPTQMWGVVVFGV